MSASDEMMRRIDQAYADQGITATRKKAYISASLSNGTELLVPVNYVGIPQQ